MATLLLDGFDKYGSAPTDATYAAELVTLLQTQWTAASGGSQGTLQLVAGLSSTGNALQMNCAGFSGPFVSKTLSANKSRLVGGVRFQASGLSPSVAPNIQFGYNGTTQCVIGVNQLYQLYVGNVATGWQGSSTGPTVLATSSASITAGTTHVLAWDITFSSAGSYAIWLDGTLVLSGTGNLAQAAGVNYVNQFALGLTTFLTPGSCVWDDLWVFDTLGTVNNAVLLTSPQIVTTFPIADVQRQWTFESGAVGAPVVASNLGGANAPANPNANSLVLRSFVATANATLTNVVVVPTNTSGSGHFQPVLYADALSGSTHIPGTLLATGSGVLGQTAGTQLVLPFTTVQSLVLGTRYWIGFITDASVALWYADAATSTTYTASNTYSSGPPATAPAGSVINDFAIWGTLSASSANWANLAYNPPVGDLSGVESSGFLNYDLYTFGPITGSVTAIYSVAYSAYCRLATTGVHNVALVANSGGGTGNGSGGATQTPAGSYTYVESFFDTDPQTGIAWNSLRLAASSAGLQITS